MSQPIRLQPEGAALRISVEGEPPPDGETLARALKDAGPTTSDPFWLEIFSRLVAIGLVEADEEATSLTSTLGLDASDLRKAVAAHAPHPLAIAAAHRASVAIRDDEEQMVLDLLLAHRADDTRETRWLAAMIARRAMQPNHLWQDLGFADRSWLNEMLRRYFPALHAGNTSDMKWKKYFYRRLCEIEGFALCTAPSCRECCDFDRCFGAEDGESLLAQRRRATEMMSDMRHLS
ncbi:MAG: nitrogen fixation protein NifQ [Rhodoblastus sp.]